MYEDINSVGVVSTVECQLSSSETGEKNRQGAYLFVDVEEIHGGNASAGTGYNDGRLPMDAHPRG